MDGLAGHAFVSYVREDSERVDRLQAVLDDAGVRVWRDTADLWPGQDWRAEIRRAITADSLAFIACFSSSSALREITYQSQELNLAVEQMRRRPPERPWLIPVRFASCDIPDLDLGEGRRLTSLQHVDLFDGSWERGIPRLLRAVLRILHQGPAHLPGLLERSGLEPALLTEFLDAASAAGSDVSPLLRGLARRQIESVTAFLRHLPRGSDIVYDGEDRDWLLGLTGEARRSITATSLATADGETHNFDGGVWASDLGARYLDRQREAIDRDVLIRRIFVFENEDIARDPAFLAITQMHRDIGVNVRTIHHRLIPAWLQWAVSDFVIFDSSVCYEASIHASAITPVTVRTSLSCAPDRIRDLDKQFDQIWRRADSESEPS